MTRWSPSASAGRASTSRRRQSGRRSGVGSSPGATPGCCVRRTPPGWRHTNATDTSPPDRCAPTGRRRPRDGALVDAVRAYLGHFGPAGIDDIGKFLGESRIRPVRDALSALENETVSVIDEDGRALVDLVDAPRPSGELEVPVRLLPKFDSLKLAYAPANRGRTLPKPYYDDVIKTANGQVLATVLVDGLGRRYLGGPHHETGRRDHRHAVGSLGQGSTRRRTGRSRTHRWLPQRCRCRDVAVCFGQS